MIQICLYLPITGEVRLRTSVPDLGTAQRLADHQGLSYIEDSLGTLDAYVAEGALHPKPPRPSPAHTWDATTNTWSGPSFESLRTAKIAEITAAFEQNAEALTEGYPPAERLTWPVQQAEALAWQADSNSPTPYLDGLAAARGIDSQSMRAKTLENVLLFISASQALIGKRQRLRDYILNATGPEELATILWSP